MFFFVMMDLINLGIVVIFLLNLKIMNIFEFDVEEEIFLNNVFIFFIKSFVFVCDIFFENV